MVSDAIREALTPALLGEDMDPEVAGLDGLPPPCMAVLDALVCCREHDYPATAADIYVWTSTGAGPVHMLLRRALVGEGHEAAEVARRLDGWRWAAAMVSAWPVLDGAEPVAALRRVQACLEAERARVAALEAAEQDYRAAMAARVEVAAVQLRGTLDRRPGYTGAVHPGWTRYLVAVGARVG